MIHFSLSNIYNSVNLEIRSMYSHEYRAKFYEAIAHSSL